MKWKRLVLEEYAPEDKTLITKVIDGDLSEKKYTPTEKFLEVAYMELNKRFFENSLPKNLTFTTEKSPKKHHIGKTNITIYDNGVVNVDGVELNSSIMLTLHEWVEAIAHEMIHVQECIEYPEHLSSENYNPHGEWFMKRASDFSEHGIRVTKTFTGNICTSVDSDYVRVAHDDEMILQIDSTKSGTPMIIKIQKKDKGGVLNKLKEMGYDTVIVLRTDNLNSTRLKLTDIGDSDDLIVYQLTSDLESNIGPLREVETIDLKKPVNEDASGIVDGHGFIEITGEDERGIHISIY